jgi:hypothetical protein
MESPAVCDGSAKFRQKNVFKTIVVWLENLRVVTVDQKNGTAVLAAVELQIVHVQFIIILKAKRVFSVLLKLYI